MAEFDFKLFAERMSIGVAVVLLAVLAAAVHVIPAFDSAAQFTTFAGGILAACAGIDLHGFLTAQKKEEGGDGV